MKKELMYEIKGYHYILIPSLMIGIFIFVYLVPLNFFQDYFNLSNNRNISSFLSTIISSISSITALLAAVLVIAFEYYKKNLKKIYLNHLLKNRNILTLVVCPLTVFLFCCISLILMKDVSPTTSGELSIIYISIISFFLLPFITFYSSYQLINTLSIDKILDQYLYDLSFDSIFRMTDEGIIEIPNNLNDKSVTKIVESDDLYIIEQLIINQYLNENFIQGQNAILSVLDKFTEYIIKNFKNSHDRKYTNIQHRVANFLHSLISNETTKVNFRLHILKRVLTYSENVYSKINIENYPIYKFKHFRRYLFGKIFETADHKERYFLLESVKNIIDDCFKNNIPHESSVMYFDLNYKSDLVLTDEQLFEHQKNWKELFEGMISYFEKELENSIHSQNEAQFKKNLDLLKSVSFPFEWTHYPVNKNKFIIGRWQILNYEKILMHYKQAIKRNVFLDITGSDTIGFDLIQLFRNNNEFAKSILTDYLHLIIWLVENKKANYSILCGISDLGEWGSIYSINGLTYLGTEFISKYHDSELYKFGMDNLMIVFEIINNRSENLENKKYLKLTASEIKRYYYKNKKNSRSRSLIRKLNGIINYST